MDNEKQERRLEWEVKRFEGGLTFNIISDYPIYEKEAEHEAYIFCMTELPFDFFENNPGNNLINYRLNNKDDPEPFRKAKERTFEE